MVISGQAAVDIMAILLKLTIMAWRIMTTDLIDIGVYSKNRKNVDQQ